MEKFSHYLPIYVFTALTLYLWWCHTELCDISLPPINVLGCNRLCPQCLLHWYQCRFKLNLPSAKVSFKTKLWMSSSLPSTFVCLSEIFLYSFFYRQCYTNTYVYHSTFIFIARMFIVPNLHGPRDKKLKKKKKALNSLHPTKYLTHTRVSKRLNEFHKYITFRKP